MASPWSSWDPELNDTPPLVDAHPTSHTSRSIPPPPGASIMSSAPPPHRAAPPGTPHPWATPFPHYAPPSAPSHTPHSAHIQSNYTFPSPQDPYATWRQHYATAYQQKSAPSPYIPRQPMHPEMPSGDPWAHLRKTNTMPTPAHAQQPTAHKRSNTMPTPQQGLPRRTQPIHKHMQWPSQADLSPLDLPPGMPDLHLYAPRAPDMHTPSSSSESRSVSSSSRAPHSKYYERPHQWRNDFKFKSNFASMFRSRSIPPRSVDDVVDSAKLDLHPFLRYSRSRPLAIYDLRCEPLTLMFRGLDRPPLADDMDHSVTHPPTQYMRLYHSRLPWYIDIRAHGAPYISLADFFQQLYAALSSQVSKYDFYNHELDDEDRDVLTRIYLDRCRTKEERMEGVKQVDFLRGKFEWMGLMPSKNGMWRLKTA